MNIAPLDVLIVGATGSIGRHVVEQSIAVVHHTRALVRDGRRGSELDSVAEIVVGDLTDAATLAEAIDGIDAVVFTHDNNAQAERRPPQALESQ